MKEKPSISRGFTLVEVMLSLALTAMLLGLLSTGVFIVAEDWNRNSDVLDEELDQALALLQIDRALHGAFPHSFTNRDTLSRQIFFMGEENSLSWVSTVSPQRTPGLTAWELYSVNDEGVYLRLAPAYSDNPAERLEYSEPSLILPGYDIEFSYLFQEYENALAWTDSWDGTDSLNLPMAVYVKFISFEDETNHLEVLARVRNNIHRSIRPNLDRQDLL